MENLELEKYIITSDCIFEPAQKPHKVCQDYALCGDSPFPFLILSDGCGSSKNTDVGSRIISHVAKSNLSKITMGYQQFGKSIIFDSLDSLKFLRINETCLDATLIIAFIMHNEVTVYMYGDGHIFITNSSGEIRFHKKVSFNQNAPYYLSYRLNEKRYKEYLKWQGSVEIGKSEIFSKSTPESNSIYEKITHPISIYEANGSSHYLQDMESLIITSDGIESFFNMRTGDKIPVEEIIPQITNFKSKIGNFVKRRVTRMLKDYADMNIFNSDDLSVAAFMFKGE